MFHVRCTYPYENWLRSIFRQLKLFGDHLSCISYTMALVEEAHLPHCICQNSACNYVIVLTELKSRKKNCDRATWDNMFTLLQSEFEINITAQKPDTAWSSKPSHRIFHFSVLLLLTLCFINNMELLGLTLAHHLDVEIKKRK